MSWGDVAKIVLSVVASLGGIGAVITAILKFSSDIIAERLSQKYELQLNKELEGYKNKLETKTYISRALFEKEFEIYQDLVNKFYDAFPNMEVVHGISESGKRIIYKDEICEDNPDLMQLGELFEGHKAVSEYQIEGQISEIQRNLLVYRKALYISGAFIPHDIQKLFRNIYDISFMYLKGVGEEKASFNDVLISIGEMQEKLREYLNSLTIID